MDCERNELQEEGTYELGEISDLDALVVMQVETHQRSVKVNRHQLQTYRRGRSPIKPAGESSILTDGQQSHHGGLSILLVARTLHLLDGADFQVSVTLRRECNRKFKPER